MLRFCFALMVTKSLESCKLLQKFIPKYFTKLSRIWTKNRGSNRNFKKSFATKMGYFLNLINEFVTKSSFNLKRLFPIVIEKNHKEEKMDEEINKKTI